jgi:hypothetical protein
VCLGGFFGRLVLWFLLFVGLFVFWVGRGFFYCWCGVGGFVLGEGCLDLFGVVFSWFVACFMVMLFCACCCRHRLISRLFLILIMFLVGWVRYFWKVFCSVWVVM